MLAACERLLLLLPAMVPALAVNLVSRLLLAPGHSRPRYDPCTMRVHAWACRVREKSMSVVPSMLGLLLEHSDCNGPALEQLMTELGANLLKQAVERIERVRKAAVATLRSVLNLEVCINDAFLLLFLTCCRQRAGTTSRTHMGKLSATEPRQQSAVWSIKHNG
jgi:Tubulin folding cofactor D C terminal